MKQRPAWLPKTFARQTLVTTIAVLFAAQLLTMIFFGVFVLRPQAERVAGIVAQSVAAVSDAADLSPPDARAAIIARLNASPFIDVWPGATDPPKSGPRPRVLERVFLQAMVEALQDRSEMEWRTDAQRRLWIQVRIGPDLYWISARSPTALQPFAAIEASAAATFVLALLAVIALQGRLMRPLERLTRTVQSLEGQAPFTRVEEAGPEELAALSRGFNAMTARLTAAENERALLLAGVSHDLRTPLAKLRLAVELIAPQDQSLARAAHAHVEEIDRVLGQFLIFARGFDAEPEVRFDLDALISEIVAMRDADGAAFSMTGASAGEIYGRPEALRRALNNLTENAVRYGAPPFTIGATRSPRSVDLFVGDGGPGAPPSVIDQLSAPFVRGTQASEKSPGAGLGLAIVERVAALHGGGLRLFNGAQGGFEARMRLALTPLDQDRA